MQSDRISEIVKEKPVKMLFALLRASLHQQNAELQYFENTTQNNWEECYRIAVKQGVMAIAWDGVLALPNTLQPPLKIKLIWAMAVERYEEKYMRYCKTVDELSTFYAKHSICTIQLKGVGLSTLYPVPSHREGGDIDIYTCSADKSRLSDAEANQLADTLMKQQGIDVEYIFYKHSHFNYKGIPIENHKFFVNVKGIKEARKANKILHRELKPITVELAEGRIAVPSPAFNTLFIAFHTLQHYGSGISLHHLCDWAMILKHYGLNMPEEMKSKKFMRGVCAMTQLCNRYLGTSIAVKDNEKVVDEMLIEIFDSPYKTVEPVKSKLGIIIYKTKRLLYRHHLKSSVFDVSLVKCIWDSIVFHIKRPHTIFARNRK